MTLDELAARAGSVDAPGAPALRLERDDEVPGVVAWFGADRGRGAVRLIVRDVEVGVLRRSDLYELLATRSMGFGDAGRAVLPGASTAWRVLELVCAQPGCPDSPLYALSFDPARPPRCHVHPQQALAPR